MARDLELARSVVDAVLRPIMATELGNVLVEVNGYEFALQVALDDVADLLDPDEVMDAEIDFERPVPLQDLGRVMADIFDEMVR